MARCFFLELMFHIRSEILNLTYSYLNTYKPVREDLNRSNYFLLDLYIEEVYLVII